MHNQPVEFYLAIMRVMNIVYMTKYTFHNDYMEEMNFNNGYC